MTLYLAPVIAVHTKPAGNFRHSASTPSRACTGKIRPFYWPVPLGQPVCSSVASHMRPSRGSHRHSARWAFERDSTQLLLWVSIRVHSMRSVKNGALAPGPTSQSS